MKLILIPDTFWSDITSNGWEVSTFYVNTNIISNGSSYTYSEKFDGYGWYSSNSM